MNSLVTGENDVWVPPDRQQLPKQVCLSLSEAWTWLLTGTALTPDKLRRVWRSGAGAQVRSQAHTRLLELLTDEVRAGRINLTGIAKQPNAWVDSSTPRITIARSWFADPFDFRPEWFDGELVPNPTHGRPAFGKCQISLKDVARLQELFDSAPGVESAANPRTATDNNAQRVLQPCAPRATGKTLEKWYQARIKAWPAETFPPNEAADRAALRAAFPNNELTRDRVRALRKLRPESWKVRGRRLGTKNCTGSKKRRAISR